MEELNMHLAYLKKKDEKAIRKSENKLNAKMWRGYLFATKVDDLFATICCRENLITETLKEYIDNALGEFFFGQPFSEAVVRSVLRDREFIATLITANLAARVGNLRYESKGQVKLRVYAAILNFDDYKKRKNSAN